MQPLAIGLDLCTIAVLGGWLALDRRAAFQFMICQPVVAVPLLGLLLGAPTVGLQLGALLQLLWMSSSLFGANVPPNETLASLGIGGMVFLTMRHGPGGADVAEIQIAAVLLGAPLSLLGRWIEIRNDRLNLRLARAADQAARASAPVRLSLVQATGISRAFVVNGVVAALAAGVGFAVLALITPALGWRPLQAGLGAVAIYVVPAVGLGVALSHVRRRRGVVLAAVVFVALLIALAPSIPP